MRTLVREHERVHELPFSSERKRMTVVYADATVAARFRKGAPESLAELARQLPSELLDAAERVGGRGPARARRRPSANSSRPAGRRRRARARPRPPRVIALHDPLRAFRRAAVDAARTAGIEIRMLTGDHPATAHTIGHALGLADDAILARATPADKLALVEELQADGDVVAVTGDGVNDAPALRRADVGVAMGRSGTEAAREAARSSSPTTTSRRSSPPSPRGGASATTSASSSPSSSPRTSARCSSSRSRSSPGSEPRSP